MSELIDNMKRVSQLVTVVKSSYSKRFWIKIFMLLLLGTLVTACSGGGSSANSEDNVEGDFYSGTVTFTTPRLCREAKLYRIVTVNGTPEQDILLVTVKNPNRLLATERNRFQILSGSFFLNHQNSRCTKVSSELESDSTECRYESECTLTDSFILKKGRNCYRYRLKSDYHYLFSLLLIEYSEVRSIEKKSNEKCIEAVGSNTSSAETVNILVEQEISVINISDATSLLSSLENDNGKKNVIYNITNDIILSNQIKPFNLLNNTVEGNGHKISNINISYGSDRTGLWERIGRSGGIINVTFSNFVLPSSDILNNKTFGLIAGINEGIIVNTRLEGTVTGNLTLNNSTAGLFVGENSGWILNSSVKLDNKIFIYGNSYCVGGIVGINNIYSNITSSYSMLSQGMQSYDEGNNSYIGGISCDNQGRIDRSFFNGIISVAGNNTVGGISAKNYGTISDSHSGGAISISNIGNYQLIGGIVGLQYKNSKNLYPIINKTYSSIKLEDSVGSNLTNHSLALLGNTIPASNVNQNITINSYYILRGSDDNVTGFEGRPITDNQMRTCAPSQQSSNANCTNVFLNWDDSIWSFTNNTYPSLLLLH